MTMLLAAYRRLDRLQRTRRFRVAASVVALALCGALFVPIILLTHDLAAQRTMLENALAGQSLAAGDEHATSLLESGTVTVGSLVYGGPEIRRKARAYFDEQGTLVAWSRLVADLLADQRPGWVPEVLLEEPATTWWLCLLAAAWLVLVVWIGLTLALVLTSAATAVPVASYWLAGNEGAMLAYAGMGLLIFTFALLTKAVLILFCVPWRPLSVAHTVVREATRSRVSLVFVVLLLVVLPLLCLDRDSAFWPFKILPIWLDPDAPLRFRVQTFISRSLGVTYVAASCMTLFLACSTVAFEIRDRQIWQVMTKPLGRLEYLVGKWLGVVAVDLVILAVAGVSIIAYIKYLGGLPVAPGLPGVLDRIAVRDEVLVARSGARPVYAELTPEQLRLRVEQQIERDPELAPRAGEITRAEKNRMARELAEAHESAQRSIPPGQSRSYVFAGLGGAKDLGATLTLRYRFHILRDDELAQFPAGFVFNGLGEEAVERLYIPTVTHVLPLGPDLIRDDGTVEVAVYNLYRPTEQERGQGELNFEEKDFELLYKVGGFEANYVRAVLMTWVKLAFLAMLGLACSTLLSFPVACMFSFTVFIAATLGPFLALSLQEYYPPDPRQWTDLAQVAYWAAKSSVRLVARMLVFMLHRFGEYRPTESLVGGQVIRWSTVAGGAFWLGLVWSGGCLLVGNLVLRNRQLAIYSGHG
jgi:hypothetical protein